MNTTETYRTTQTATLLLTPAGEQVKVTLLDKNFNGTRREELNDIEQLASAALRITRGLAYRGAFKRMVLNQHPAETRKLDAEIKVRVSMTFVSKTGYLNMTQESESAEVLS